MKQSIFDIKLRRNIMYLLTVLIFCGCASVMAADTSKFSSVDIEESLLLGQDIKTIETKFGTAKFVKGISSLGEKIFTRNEWDKFAWESYAGHYLYRFKRDDNEIEYAIIYRSDTSKSKFHPIERALRIWITFDKLPTMNELSALIPEMKVFDNPSIGVFIKNTTYSDETKLLYIANSSKSAGLIAAGWEEKSSNAGFSIEISLEEKTPSPNELSKVKELIMDVSGMDSMGHEDYQPFHFIKLSK